MESAAEKLIATIHNLIAEDFGLGMSVSASNVLGWAVRGGGLNIEQYIAVDPVPVPEFMADIAPLLERGFMTTCGGFLYPTEVGAHVCNKHILRVREAMVASGLFEGMATCG